jgi:uncharacterized membrane protein
VLVLDFIRFTALLLMIQGHTLEALVDPARIDYGSFPWHTWLQLRGLTAPLFMMVSGAATVLGIRHDGAGRLVPAVLWRRVRTACMVIGIGYLLVFPADRIIDLPWVSADVWREFFQVNILQANGATLLLLTALLACTRTVRRYAAWSVGLGALILLANPVVNSVDWFRLLPEGLAAYLSNYHGSTFPLFPASAFMFIGVGFGALLRESRPGQQLRRFRLACMAAGAGFLALGLAAGLEPAGLLPPHEYYQGSHAYTCFRFGFALLIFALLAWAAEWRPALASAAAPLGRRSLAVYVVHLVLIFGSHWSPGLAAGRHHALTVAQGLVFVPLVGGATFALVLAWDWVQKHPSCMGRTLKLSAAVALGVALLV